MPIAPIPANPNYGTRVAIMSYASQDPLLCLGVDVSNGGLRIIADRHDPGDTMQQWGMIDAGNGMNAFFNFGAQSLLYLSGSDGELSLMPQIPAVGQTFDWRTTWTMASGKASVNWWALALLPFTDGATGHFVVNAPHAGLAIRPSSDDDRNLNVLGNGPYNPGSLVAAWDGWGGGDANEVWMPVAL